ncbi:hypothetical protein L3Q82_015048 [Scortum barcoo]|uniref:Uncharacterized protein n=1 Tax=Scortum barcoo TaxID=214431 RepID=A0ACB8VSG7_9TELE|nr:hypothetical protein L3Q82_015048 [Scortum barcoo]
MQSLISRLEGFTAASPSPPAAPAPPAAPPAAAAAPPSAASGAIFLACLLRSGPPGLTTEVFRAAAWATAEWSRAPKVCQTAQDFSQALLRVFDQTSPAREASSALLKIQQGRRRVVDYALEFRMTLAADSGWNETSIIGALMDGLAEEVKDFLAPLDIPRDFKSLVEIASRIDNRLRERERERRRPGRKSSGFQGGAALLPSPDTTCDPIPDHSDYPDLSKVPPCYYDLKEVFSKTKATSLPPHREWDCAIELLPGAPIPKA